MIGPSEPAASVAQVPAAGSGKLLFYGVLRENSSLVVFLGTRVIPVRSAHPTFLFLGGRYLKAVEIPYNDLTEAHRRGFMEWLDMHLPNGTEFAKAKIAQTGICSVAWEHFSGIVSGEQIEAAKPE